MHDSHRNRPRPEDERPRTRRSVRGRIGLVAAAVAGALVLLLAIGVVLDYRSFDRTSGGYEPPYDDWTGTPIDWDATERTPEGFRMSGRVVDYGLDCTTGMITFTVLGISRDWRTVSERAIAVHGPREACAEEGFTPRF